MVFKRSAVIQWEMMDGLELPEKRTWLGIFPGLRVLHYHRAGCHWRTDSLVFGAPKQGGSGMRPWLNCSKLNLFWETVSVYIRRHSSTGRKARHLFFGKITNVHQGSEPPSGSRGIFFINLTGQTKTLNHPNFHFLF